MSEERESNPEKQKQPTSNSQEEASPVEGELEEFDRFRKIEIINKLQPIGSFELNQEEKEIIGLSDDRAGIEILADFIKRGGEQHYVLGYIVDPESDRQHDGEDKSTFGLFEIQENEDGEMHVVGMKKPIKTADGRAVFDEIDSRSTMTRYPYIAPGRILYTGEYEARIAPASHGKQLTAEYDKTDWQGRAKEALAYTAIFATLGSGGVVDRGAEAFIQPDDVVTDVLGNPHNSTTEVTMETEFDGIPLKDYDPETRQRFKEILEGDITKSIESYDSILSAYEMLDNHQGEELHSLAVEVRENNPDQYVSSEIINEALKQIEVADSVDEIIQITNEFLSFYNTSIGVINEGAEAISNPTPNEVGKVSIKLIQILSLLPRDLVEDNFKDIESGPAFRLVSKADLDDSIKSQLTGGYYTKGTVTLPLRNLPALINKFPSETMSLESVLAHEIGHAIDPNMDRYAHSYDEVDSGEGPEDLLEHAARYIGSVPEHASSYGLAGGDDENRAELFRLILTGEIPHPDQARLFQSEVSKDIITIIHGLELEYPGISTILLNNSQRGVAAVGR